MAVIQRKLHILLTGHKSGLGAALHIALQRANHHVYTYDKEDGGDVRNMPNLGDIDHLDVLINNAGINDIDWLENFTEDRWDEVMDTNAKGIYMMTRACLPFLQASAGTVLNIVSNAATVPMRCSLAYNASKAAARMMTFQMARELSAHDITVFSISPNKLANTGMSRQIEAQVCSTRGWSVEQARAYQAASLLTGEETPVERVVEFIVWLLSDRQRHFFLTGCDIPYGA